VIAQAAWSEPLKPQDAVKGDLISAAPGLTSRKQSTKLQRQRLPLCVLMQQVISINACIVGARLTALLNGSMRWCSRLLLGYRRRASFFVAFRGVSWPSSQDGLGVCKREDPLERSVSDHLPPLLFYLFYLMFCIISN
jgi:hypothetical protein